MCPISAPSLAEITALIEIQEVKKGEQICTVGRSNNLEYFLLEGICKSYLHTPEAEEITISFFMEGAVISPSTTRNVEGKAILNMCALTDVKLAAMPAQEFEKLMIDNLEIRQFGNTVLQYELQSKVQKEIALASLKGKERLEYLRKCYPNIENCIPHSDIASFLGMTTISLSRLRGQS